MKVKIDDTIYDGRNQPIMVILDDQDKINILTMKRPCTKYCVYPSDKYSEEEIRVWMDGDLND